MTRLVNSVLHSGNEEFGAARYFSVGEEDPQCGHPAGTHTH